MRLFEQEEDIEKKMGRKSLIPDDILIQTYIKGKAERKQHKQIAQMLGMKPSALSERLRNQQISTAIKMNDKIELMKHNEEIRGISEQRMCRGGDRKSKGRDIPLEP